jgi:hypothetical protein
VLNIYPAVASKVAAESPIKKIRLEKEQSTINGESSSQV